MPRPHPSITLQLSLPSRSWLIPLDDVCLRVSKRYRLHYALYPFITLWATMVVLLIWRQYYSSSPEVVDCTTGMWYDWPPDGCGMNGTDCVDFLEAGEYRCPANCLDTHLGNSRWVGGEEVDDVPLVIGSGVYR